jgi:hypothetical protein
MTAFKRHSLSRFAIRAALPVLVASLFAAVAYGHGRRPDSHPTTRPPRVPADLQVPAGNQVKSRAPALGVQIYTWNVDPNDPAQSSWILKAPHALLFGRPSEVEGIHFGGPTWQANDGSKVIGARLASAIVEEDAIPWLLLEAVSNEGEGAFGDTTYIQRVNTMGGVPPETPGTYAGQEVLVPYFAEYYFYRAVP